jgi:hypothetical protein
MLYEFLTLNNSVEISVVNFHLITYRKTGHVTYTALDYANMYQHEFC